MPSILFTDGSDLKGVESSKDIRYMKLLRITLSSLAAWPGKQLGDPESRLLNYQRVFLVLQQVACLPAQILYIQHNVGKLDLNQMGHLYITCFMNILALTRSCLPVFQGYGDIFRSFVQDLHLFHQKEKSDYANKVHLQIHKLSNFFTIYLIAMMIGGIFLFNATPLLNNYISGAFSLERPSNVTFEESVYYYLPIQYETEFNSYIGVCIFNWYISYFTSAAFCIYDLLLSLMVFHLWGHLKILNYNLKTFPRPLERKGNKWNAEFFSKEEMKQVFLILTEQINYHRFIMDFATRMSNFFGPMLCLYYLFHQASGCLLLLECSQMSERLKDAVYSLPWECMDTSNGRVVLIFLNKVQTPIRVKAMGVADVGVRTMASIIKTSLSYFTFLRTTSD